MTCSSDLVRDGGIDATPETGTPGVSVEIGTGQTDWEDLASTDPHAELIYGSQGGFHIWGRARFHGLNPDVMVSFSVQRLDDGAVLHAPMPVRRWIEGGVRRGLLDLGGGDFATDAELVYLNIQCTRELVGRQILWQVRVEERNTGRFSTAQRIVTVVDDLPTPVACAPR